MSQSTPYDALLLCSFGGPNASEDVVPFLRNVVRGKGVPDERLEEVAGQQDDAVLQAVTARVLSRPLQRLGGDVDAPDLCVRGVRCDGEPDDPRARTDVRDDRLALAGDRPHHGIEAGAVTSAGHDCDSFHDIWPTHSFTIEGTGGPTALAIIDDWAVTPRVSIVQEAGRRPGWVWGERSGVWSNRRE